MKEDYLPLVQLFSIVRDSPLVSLNGSVRSPFFQDIAIRNLLLAINEHLRSVFHPGLEDGFFKKHPSAFTVGDRKVAIRQVELHRNGIFRAQGLPGVDFNPDRSRLEYWA